MFTRVNRPSPWIWMSAGFLSLSLIAVLGVMLLIGWKGLSYFWVNPVYQFEIQTPKGVETYFGEIYNVQSVSSLQLLEAGVKNPSGKDQRRFLIKIGNRDIEGQDFISVLEQDIVSKVENSAIAVVERTKEGVFFGIPAGYLSLDLSQELSQDLFENVKIFGKDDAFFQKENQVYQQYIALAKTNREEIAYLESHIIEEISEQLRQLKSEQAQNKNAKEAAKKNLENEIAALGLRYRVLEQKVITQRALMAKDRFFIKDRNGKTVFIPIEDVLALWYPNAMSMDEKWRHFGHQISRFVSESPREGNSEGGVFPAIFGTVLMVMLMAVIVTPLGVLAALYLHEYANKNMFTRFIRIAVINLAGVPSIVYGVFGLGFFVYFIGGNVDALFYSDALPNPTFGTPGLLWSSLTLAVLTLPVVIVSTEEGLSRIPLSVRHGSMALGATKAETLWRIVLPMVSPAIMTGLVLAIARAAGEVAPLMLVGVVKVAPSLALDTHFPYLHLDRKFMHLGYHIYDAGFQSPNIEAARPLVYATSLLLLSVIISLNLTAMSIRHHLREKYRALEETL